MVTFWIGQEGVASSHHYGKSAGRSGHKMAGKSLFELFQKAVLRSLVF